MTVIEQRTMDAIQSINRKMKDNAHVDWEQRRYEIAKEVLVGFVANPKSNEFGATMKTRIMEAVTYAEALISELRKPLQ